MKIKQFFLVSYCLTLSSCVPVHIEASLSWGQGQKLDKTVKIETQELEQRPTGEIIKSIIPSPE